MVNTSETFGIDAASGHPEHALALSYAARDRREGIEALFALDATLAQLVFGTRDPLIAQLRLTWWYEALNDMGKAPTAAQPILRVLARSGIDGPALSRLVDGWEALLQEGDVDLGRFAAGGEALFEAAAQYLRVPDPVSSAGRGWALARLSRATSRVDLRDRAVEAALPLLDEASARRWSSGARALGALVHIGRADLDGRHPPGSPRRVARLALLRLTGR